jgi:uncharacterized membrane protein
MRKPILFQLFRKNSITLGHSLLSFVLMLALCWLFLYRNPQPDYNDILSLMIGALVTVVTVMFSAVLVALQLASAQFSPRITRGFFAQNKRVQLAFYAFLLGISFLLGIKFTRSVETGAFMFEWLPIVGAVYGFFLMSFVLPRFVFYIADAINAATISNQIAKNTLKEIDLLYPPGQSHGTEITRIAPDKASLTAEIRAEGMGFLEMIDLNALAKLAGMHGNIQFQSEVMVGNFIAPGETLMKLSAPLTNPQQEQIKQCYTLSKYRSYEQDILFGVRQLVDMSLKAISPAVNDPTTCVNCIHYLGVIVEQYAQRSTSASLAMRTVPSNVHLREFHFEMLLDSAFDQIYQYGRQDYVIVSQLLRTLYEVSGQLTDPNHLAAMRTQVAEFEINNHPFVLGEHQTRIDKLYKQLKTRTQA